MDPLALRMKNYADADPQENKPWSSKALRECYRLGAEKFGWPRRTPAPRSMRNGNTLIGMGMASATYPANRSKASAIARILPDGTAMVASGTQDLGTIRVPRVVGVYDVGRVQNQKTARSQLMGGIVWGVGAALREETSLDVRYGRFTNTNLAEYHVPVNADIGSLDITFLDQPDPYINSLGVRGIGEIGITGVPVAIANAVYHATGVGVRDLLVTLDKVMGTVRV